MFCVVTYAIGSSASASHDFTNLNAGDYTLWGRVIDKNGGFTDYSTNVTVGKATATVVVVDYTGTYDGAAHTASVTITGVGSDGTLTSNSMTGTNVAESGSVTASISGLQNYNDASGTATLTINKAELRISRSATLRRSSVRPLISPLP